jgi:hypothetical protein
MESKVARDSGFFFFFEGRDSGFLVIFPFGWAALGAAKTHPIESLLQHNFLINHRLIRILIY